jgi:hypothetical protein
MNPPVNFEFVQLFRNAGNVPLADGRRKPKHDLSMGLNSPWFEGES